MSNFIKYINKCDICAKKSARYGQIPTEAPRNTKKYLEVPMAVLAMDTIGHLPVMSRGHQWALTAICMHMSYAFTILVRDKSAENVIQAYLSRIFAYKEGSIAILTDDGTELKNTVLTDACEQLGIKRLYSNPFHPQGNSRTENTHNFVKRALTKFLHSSDLELDVLLSFTCSPTTYYLIAMEMNHHFVSCLAVNLKKGN